MQLTEEQHTFDLDRARLALRADANGHPWTHIACPECLARRTVLQLGLAVRRPDDATH